MFSKLKNSLNKRVLRRLKALGKQPVGKPLEWGVEALYLLKLWQESGAVAARFKLRPIDVGIGPEPIVNHTYHKKALEKLGFTAETFVSETYFITQAFDLNTANSACPPAPLWLAWTPYLAQLHQDIWLYRHVIHHYKALFIHFNGGPLYRSRLLRYFEPKLLKQANVKVLVSPYGSDIQNLRFSKDLKLKHAYITDYPKFYQWNPRIRWQEPNWTLHADYVLSGCDWVEYMHHWHQLVLTDWCIDVDAVKPSDTKPSVELDKPFRVLHAPNHREIKGTRFLQQAINALQEEGLNIELLLLEGVPNTQILETLHSVDLVADQFIVGWYGFFAVEAMAAGKPVMSYIRSDYLELFTYARLLEEGELPVLNTGYREIQDQLRWAYHHREDLASLGTCSRDYVVKHHSLARLGQVFQEALTQMGVEPKPVLNLDLLDKASLDNESVGV